MNRPHNTIVIVAMGLLLILVWAVSFAKLCTGYCRRYCEGPRDVYCRDCGGRLIWWWRVPFRTKFWT